MTYDAHKNFAQSLVATAPSPPDSGTTLDITLGTESKFPAAPFNVTVWPKGTPTDENAEIVRVLTIVGNTFTVLRAQEGTSAQSINVGFSIADTITVKTITDIQNQTPVTGSKALNNGVSSGSVTGLGLSFTPSRVMLSISRPSGGDFIFALDNTGTLTSDGFDFELSAATTSANFVLNYALYQ